MQKLVDWLHIFGWFMGGLVIVQGVYRAATGAGLPPLLISVGVVIVGPVETILTRRARGGVPPQPEPPVLQLIDQGTSVGFLIFLFATIVLL